MYVDQQKQLEDPLLLCCVVGDNSLYTLYICGLMTMLFVVNKGLEPLSPSEIPWTVHSRCLVFWWLVRSPSAFRSVATTEASFTLYMNDQNFGGMVGWVVRALFFQSNYLVVHTV